ncbi:hypothetical protein SISNIDRAFT_546815 [Sistotremastrum niveocremeum HHB9708]|uniref:STEEP1 domain-containing protein n=2 Tax=Sistotremastraceae TaxID=3402574 RepID=A0A164ZIX2_9AGAM|nr:hypothetical protein SISNIDRAFT_546815 [Sistotremastrum niveocremeum HHB9708]KZT42879.1 hypothetical protein SISSUDRAFT_998088 [Sistotremastrum suecicum HHB10207 ss-3]
MPKVVSRSAISSSTDAKPTASSTAALKVYYCLCGEFILVVDRDLGTLPRRRTDESIILRNEDDGDQKAQIFKVNAVHSGPTLIERATGLEKLWQFHCPRCNLPIGYQITPPPAKSGPFFYLLRGALTQIQGQLPVDAFEGEEDVQGVEGEVAMT